MLACQFVDGSAMPMVSQWEAKYMYTDQIMRSSVLSKIILTLWLLLMLCRRGWHDFEVRLWVTWLSQSQQSAHTLNLHFGHSKQGAHAVCFFRALTLDYHFAHPASSISFPCCISSALAAVACNRSLFQPQLRKLPVRCPTPISNQSSRRQLSNSRQHAGLVVCSASCLHSSCPY